VRWPARWERRRAGRAPSPISVVTLLLGIVTVRIAVQGTYQRFVRVGMGPWLMIAGVLLCGLGLVTVARWYRSLSELGRQRSDGDIHDHHADDLRDGVHEHAHRLSPGWLLVVPVAMLLVSPPAGLNSYFVTRDSAMALGASSPTGAGGGTSQDLPTFPPLTTAEAAHLTLLELTGRALDRKGATLAGRPLTLIGFVAGDRVDGGFMLARYAIFCCAADALASRVRVLNPATGQAVPPLRRDQWVRVRGVFVTLDADDVPRLTATDVTPIDGPDNPYEQPTL